MSANQDDPKSAGPLPIAPSGDLAAFTHDLTNQLLAARLRSEAARRIDDPAARAKHLDELNACLDRAIELIKALRRG